MADNQINCNDIGICFDAGCEVEVVCENGSCTCTCTPMEGVNAGDTSSSSSYPNGQDTADETAAAQSSTVGYTIAILNKLRRGDTIRFLTAIRAIEAGNYPPHIKAHAKACYEDYYRNGSE